MINKFQTEGYNFMRYLIIGNLNSLQYRALLNCFLDDCQHFSVCSFKIHKKSLKESYNKFFEDFNYYKCDSYDFILPQRYEKGQKFYVYELNDICRSTALSSLQLTSDFQKVPMILFYRDGVLQEQIARDDNEMLSDADLVKILDIYEIKK